MTTPRILIIDHQKNLRQFYQTWLEPVNFEIHFVTTGREALNRIATERFDLALLELSLPDGDSLALLRSLKETNPTIPVIIGFESEAVTVTQVTTAVQLGAVAFIEKPYHSEALLESVWSAHEQYPAGVVCGNLRDLSLPNLVSLLCYEGKTACLEIRWGSRQAALYFDRGQIIHAVAGQRRGEEAIFEAVTWEEGEFTITSDRQAPERTIETSWSKLLLEGMNRLDEAGFDQEQLEPDQAARREAAAQPVVWSQIDAEPAAVPNGSMSITLDADSQLQIKTRLDHLHRSIGGRCTLLVNHTGRLFHAQSQFEESRNLALAALVASSFSAHGHVTKILAHEEEKEPQLHYSLQEGSHFNLYSAQIGADWIVTVAFDPNVTNLGLARQLTLQTASDLTGLLYQAPAVPADPRQEALGLIDDAFQQTIDDAFEDLFAKAWEE